MEIHRIPVGLHQANCYVVKNDGDLFVIDPGARPERIKTYLAQGDRINAILLTHGHFDHIGAVDELAKEFKCPVYLHEDDEELVLDSELNYSQTRNVTVKSPLTFFKEGVFRLSATEFHIIHAPGHTKGSVLIGIQNELFTGDVLFKNSVGRTDLTGGNDREMKASLRIIKTLDKNLRVHPGHGESTTIESELKSNPFLKF